MKAMQKRNSASKNVAWIISCKIVQSLLGIVVGMLTARYLGPSNYGLINYAASLVAFALPVARLGFSSTLVNEIIDHQDQEGEILGTSLFFSFLSAVACIFCICIFAYAENPNEKVTVWVCALYSLCLLAQVLEMIQYWFQAKMIAQYVSLTALAAYIVVTGYKIFLLITGKSIYWFAVSNALDYVIVMIVLLGFYHRLGGQKLRVSWECFGRMFARSKYFILSSLMVTVFAQTDKIMLKATLTEEAVGIYSAAMNCAGLTSFVFSAIIDSVRPMVFEKKKTSKEEYENSLTACYSIIIYLSLAQSLVCAVFSKFIIRILYGNEYAAAANVLRLAVWYTTFSYIGPVRNIWILAENKQNYLWIINLSGAAGNVILNAVLIPCMGVMGAALASLITQIFTNVIIGFIFEPIRENNVLLVKSWNPKILIDLIRTVYI